jgi:hypothetical protein
MEKVSINSGYESVGEYGYDFNVLKHKNHGIEWRVLDSFDKNYLEEVSLCLILIAEFSSYILTNHGDKAIPNPRLNEFWNEMTYKCLFEQGSEAEIDFSVFTEYLKLDVTTEDIKSFSAYEGLNWMMRYLFEKFKEGELVKKFYEKGSLLREPLIPNFNKIVKQKFLMQ